MALFLDLLHVPVGLTNDTIDGLYKALSDGHDHGDGIWKPHQSPLIRRLVELFTQRGLTRLDSVHKELLAWQQGHRHVPSPDPVPAPPGALLRWTPAELSLVSIYLEALPPAKWTLSDHMLAIDYVCQRYLPADELVLESQWLATRATLMGKVQANLAAELTTKQADAVLQALPTTVSAAAASFQLGPALETVLQFAARRAAEHVQALADGVRHRMRNLIAEDLEARSLGALPPGTSSLETKLSDAFGALNRDWRRIAITEAGEAQLQGFIASLPPGTRVKRVERYDTACSFCRSIDGRIATVVSPEKANKDPDTEVWLGKNNMGRSASPMKRVGGALVPRDPEEMWWLPAGLAHPNCRGRWIPVQELDPGDDPDFAAELAAILGSS